MVWFIIISVLLFLLFYPVAFRYNFYFKEEEWQGRLTLHPIFCLKPIKFTLYDSNKPKKDKKKKKTSKKGDTDTEEDNATEKKDTKMTTKALLEQLKKQPLSETISMMLDLLKSTKKGIKRLRVEVNFAYALEDPAQMGYLTAAIHSVVPAFLGNMKNTRWRIRIYPQWQSFTTMAAVNGKTILCLFDLFYAFGGILKKLFKIIIEKIRRKS